jgi:hypothetical protein
MITISSQRIIEEMQEMLEERGRVHWWAYPSNPHAGGANASSTTVDAQDF